MSVDSVSMHSSSVAQEDLKAKPPLAGSFESLTPPPSRDPIVDFDSAPHSATSSFSSAPAPASTPVVAMGSVKWPSLLRDFQEAVLPEAVASFKYYRNVSFAAVLCGECSDAEAAGANLAKAALYAAASKTLYKVVACEGSPSSADNVSNLLAQARLAVPQIEAAQSAATAAKDYSKAAELQSMRASLVQLVSQADDLLREHPTCPAITALQRFSLQLQRLTTTKILSKKWFSRHFVLSNGYLHYADGDNGFHLILEKARFRSCAATRPPAGGTAST
jgi:hypothetical protein